VRYQVFGTHCLVSSVILGTAGLAFAQPTVEEPMAPAADTARAPANPPSAPADAASPDGPVTVAELAERVTAQQRELQTLKNDLASQRESMQSQQEAVQAQLAASSEEAGSGEKLMSAWGFFDVTFGKLYFDNSKALYRVRTPVNSSFMMSGINLYLKSQMTRTLSALVETRLTFTPVGYKTSLPVDVYVNKALVQQQGEYSRGGAAMRGPLSQLDYRQHGIMIERAHLDYSPFDWLSLRAGRYLTPFGIWNEDHGSPVLLGVDTPNLVNFTFVPIWQTGIEAFGRRDLGDSVQATYALTLSNGRGPVDEYQDLDSNKAVGLRATIAYTSGPLSVRLGAYGYRGRFTDREERTEVHLLPDMTLDPNASAGFGTKFVTRDSYDETTVTGDLTVTLADLHLFSEAAWRRVDYRTSTLLPDSDKLLNGVPFSAPVYAAGHYGGAVYSIAGYEFDLGAPVDHTKLTPYAGFDYLLPDSTLPTLEMWQYRAGLNVKPSPWVTAKLEVIRVDPKTDAIASEAWAVLSQLAVSF
jgi:hypothetical protein